MGHHSSQPSETPAPRTTSERWFEQIVTAAPTALLFSDPADVICYANRRTLDWFGYAEPELLGAPLTTLLPQPLHETYTALRQQLELPAGEPQFGPVQLWRGRHRNGREFPIALRLLPVTGENGLALACAIDERGEAEAAWEQLADSRYSLRQIVENTTAVVYVKDLQGRYLLVNSQFEKLFHLSREEIHGRSDFDVFPFPMAQAFRVNDRRVARTGEILKVDEVAPHDDGPHTYVSVKFPLRDREGEIFAVAGISTDITDRVRAEGDADDLRNQLEVILNAIHNGIVGLDRQGNVTFANPTARQLLRADSRELGRLMPAVAMDVATRTDPVDESTPPAPIGQETRLRRADGATFFADVQVYSVIERGRREGAVVSFRDVSDRKRRELIERQLQSARAVQQILYPHCWPSCPGLDIAGHVYSAEAMCGDYLDFIRSSEDELTIAVGDVSGHGFGPALQMVETRACLRAMLQAGHSLAESVTALNRILITDIPPESFITLFAAKIDVPTLTLRCVTAGHVAWLFRNGSPPRRIAGVGLVLGIDLMQAYACSDPCPLQSGDTLLIPTDGVQETQNPQRKLFGTERMLQTVTQLRHLSAVEIVDGLYQATIDFAGPRRQSDDVTIAVVKVR